MNLKVIFLYFLFFSCITACNDYPHTRDREELIDISKDIFDAAQFGSKEDVKNVLTANGLNSKEKCIVLRLAAQRAEKEKDKITRKLLEKHHDAVLYTPGCCTNLLLCGTGILGSTLRIGTWPIRAVIKPIKKGFDGACYTVGGIVGATTLGAVLAAPPVFIIATLLRTYIT